MKTSTFLGCAAALLSFLALGYGSCRTDPVPPPQPDVKDAAPVAADAGDCGCGEPTTPCAKACARLCSLHCDAAKPTAKGASFTTVCQNTENTGSITLHPDCLANAMSCDVAKACSK